MARPPFVFGDPEIVMQASGRYMGEPLDIGAPGYYMGETLAAASLYSRYFDGLVTALPIDSLSPEPYILLGNRLLDTQDISVVSAGRNSATLEFTIPLCNEEACEFLLLKGPAATGPEPASTLFTPLVAGTITVYSGGLLLGAPGGSTTIPLGPDFGARKATVVDATGFSIGQWVKITNTIGGEIQIVKIVAIDTLELTFSCDILMITEDTATIETINDAVVLTEVTDWTVTLATGDFTVLETAATTGKYVWTSYKTELMDYDGGDFWLISGLLPLPDSTDPEAVSVYPGAIFLGATTSLETSFTFERDGADLGRNFTIYAIARDDEAPPNPSVARAATFTQIPARPVTASVIGTSSGSITIGWNDTTLDGSVVTGYNVVRNPGISFVPAIAERLNEELITSLEFTDASGAPNRRPVGEVAAPVDGEFVTYSVESAVETGQWSILTANLRVDQGEITTAEKQLI